MGNNTKDFIKLKKEYGEKFAQFCRSSFPTILENGNLYDIISKLFAPNRFLYDDLTASDKIQTFKEFVYGEVSDGYRYGVSNENIETPEELMKKAGYTLKKCNSVAEIEEFEKYYAEDEVLCTFRNPDRKLMFHTIFFAVKDNVEEIKREDFLLPRRQDEYGTSVISIQFSKAKKNRMISIKNRYNHKVPNCDATFSNDLENIYPGLTDSFVKHYNINLNKSHQNFAMDNYVVANDKRFYRYNYHINNFYYCPDNVVIIDGDPQIYDKGKYEVFDYFVLDKKQKFMHFTPRIDSFIRQFDNITEISITKIGGEGNKLITIQMKGGKNIEIIVNSMGQMISLKNPNLQQLDDYFLYDNKYLQSIDVENVKTIGKYVLTNNKNLKQFNIPNIITDKSDLMKKYQQNSGADKEL